MKDGQYPKLMADALAAVAPLKDGRPDLYNHLPSRFITIEEAKFRGWKYFYIGDGCKYGHKAPRFVSNPRMCVDCHRTREGRLTMGGKLEALADPHTGWTKPAPVKDTKKSAPAARQIILAEPDKLEKAFLVEYAKLKDFSLAAQACGRVEADFLARLSYSEVFREAIRRLEEDCGLQHIPTLLDECDWNDDKRATLLRVYVDTGDITAARSAVQVSNYHFIKELETNLEFATEYAEAQILAEKYVGEVGVSQAMRGDTRLLQRYLANVRPDQFGETSKVRVDLNVTEKLTDEQLNARFAQAVRQLGGRTKDTVDAEFCELEPPREVEALGVDRDPSPTRQPESNLDLV